MSFQEKEIGGSCFRGRHNSATKNVYGDITSKGSKVLIGYCSRCNREKSMTVGDKTVQTEGFSNFFKNLNKKGLNVSKN